MYDSWMGSAIHSFSKGLKFKCALNKEMKGKETLLIVKKAIVFAIGLIHSLIIIGLSQDLSFIMEVISGVIPSVIRNAIYAGAFYLCLNGFMLHQAKTPK